MARGKRFFLFLLVPAAQAVLAPPIVPQEKTPEAVNVVVRVSDHGRFVGGLSRQDFELQEDGVVQKIDAVYEVAKNAVTRQDGEGPAAPVTARRFYLLFQMYEVNPKVSEALRYFFQHALLPGDTLEIQTPVRTYRLTPEAFAKKPSDVLAKELDGIVRKDIGQGNLVYQDLIRELKRFVNAIEGLSPAAQGDAAADASVSYFGLERMLSQYRESLMKLEAMLTLDQEKIIGFARSIKKQPGRRSVFLIYQQEFRPELTSTTLNGLISTNQDNQNILSDLHDLFQMYHRDISLDQKAIVQAYCDSGADLHFLFMARSPERFGGIAMREQSEDIFKIFSKVAAATAGIAESTQNPVSEITDALNAGEKYYLLTYVPTPAAQAGSFKTITVKVKDKDYKVSNRQGYLGK
jgi:VWFA-related protein